MRENEERVMVFLEAVGVGNVQGRHVRKSKQVLAEAVFSSVDCNGHKS